MDENPNQNTDLLEPEEQPQQGRSLGQRAAETGHSLNNAVGGAKDVYNKVNSGESGLANGLGKMGESLKNGLGAVSGGGTPGIGGLNKSMDGMKGMGDKVPQMFKGMEGDSKPLNTNDPNSEKNPSAKDAAKKMAGNKAGDIAGQTASDVKEGVKDSKDIAKLVGTGGSDATAWADLAKRALQDPKAFVKRYGRYGIYVASFIAFQCMLVVAILGVLFFGIYKVYLAGKSVWDNPLDIANTIRVTTDMGGYLAKFATQLAYDREMESAKQSGVAFAADANRSNYDLSQLKVNPETEKMYTTWNNAGLAEKFLDDYNAEIKPNGSARQVDSYSPSAWDLYVNSKYVGRLDSVKARAYLSLFAEDTTHWKDIYTRVALKDAAKNKYSATSFKLTLPDSKNSINESRKNVTQKVVKDTLTPISKNAGTYYDCLIDGSDSCNGLGLGSSGAPSNNSSGSIIGNIVKSVSSSFGLISGASPRASVAKGQLVTVANGKSSEVTSDSASYDTKENLAANISTASSDAVLSGIDDSRQSGQVIKDVFLQMYDQFNKALDNLNFSRVNYDRTSQQSVGESLNYFTAGGQLLNGDIGLLDSWALSENLSTIDSSQTLRQAVYGNPIGVYAQSSSTDSTKTCQQIYDDNKPVDKADGSDNQRSTKTASCFTSSLLPNVTEFKNEKTLNTIYTQLDTKTAGNWLTQQFTAITQGVLAGILATNGGGPIRTSPVAVASVDIDQKLAPDFDAYMNQVYGVSKTGAEINGEAYDTMKMAAESLWTSSETTGAYSTGGSYQDDASVAATTRYAKELTRERYAFESPSERFLSLKTPDSLAGKLALLTPTTGGDAIGKTLALLKPSNLTSAVASRFTPTSFAQSVTTSQVNPVGAIRFGYSATSASNSMDSLKLWDSNNCANGGPQQTTGVPEGIPFTVPTSANPCKQVSVLAKMTTCYFDTADSCSKSEGGGTTTSDSASPGDISADSSGTPCYAGTNDAGIRDDAYTKGERIRIRLCEIPLIPCQNEECVQFGNGHAVVSSIASEAWFKLATKAQQLRIPLSATSSWRSMSHQERLCNKNALCRSGTYSAVARPGTSNHQAGVAIDITEAGVGQGASSGRTCSNPQTANTATYQFLSQYAGTFGIKQYANESWHWGTAEKC